MSAARIHRSRVMLEPAGLTRVPAAPDTFDHQAFRNLGQSGIAVELPVLPDNILIATLVQLGCPRWAAEQVRTHPPMRFNAVAVWCLVQDAREGNMVRHGLTGELTSARDLIDGIRAAYADARKLEMIHDVPGHTIGLGDR